ncbi:MAG: Molybdopterin-synthase adenylyltransferase [uncultured Sphingomonadaceae bacterium]|uniref:Molybdopterin-synthase adenylyltransferase n=1 Tax=uncultured Sphingomonadaceae bacterium TaxID=169976 RepID=A0A6J4TI22_9SPHN|nr:MAG: Molybdopterin-synthase adenylyltransferase [uncultured Sphingomonadaceae bacterium]
MSLRDDQLERYGRHLLLKEIGGAGQRRVLAARVAVVGAGGIGSPALLYLAAAGIGRLTVIDDDVVALSNLQRQVLFGTDDVGAAKVARAADGLRRLNPDVEVRAVRERLTPENAAELLDGAEVVVDGSDSFATRLAVNDATLALRVPLVSAAVGQLDGQLAVYRGWEAGRPCYRCLVGNAAERADGTCADDGVLGALTGVLGSLAALEAVRALWPFGEDPTGQMLLVDALQFRFRTVRVVKDPGCAACAG